MVRDITQKFWWNAFHAMSFYGHYSSIAGATIDDHMHCPITGDTYEYWMLVLPAGPRFFETEQEALDCATIHDVEGISLQSVNFGTATTTEKGQGEGMYIEGDIIITGSIICGGNVHSHVPASPKDP